MNTIQHTKAVILARGLGTRMRQEAGDAPALDEHQARVAATGVKAMMPTLGRPFLDFVLAGLVDAGYRQVCLVIGPEHDAVREYYGKTLAPKKLGISFAVQEKPLGTADAVRPAEAFAAGEPFLMINSDNYYPAAALAGLARTAAPAVAVFEKDALVSGGNIHADRIGKFSVVLSRPDGSMEKIVEKPTAEFVAAMTTGVFVSMNCWLFDSSIFDACRAIGPSPRGEYEITDAVQYSIDHLGKSFGVLKLAAPVLDLSSRADVGPVADKLAGIKIDL